MPARGGVDVWLANFADCLPCLAAWAEWLSGEERERARRFHFPRDRDRFALARGFLRLLLSRYVGLPPDQIHLDYTSAGKPFLTPAALPGILRNYPGCSLPTSACQSPNALQFNLSHSGPWVLVGISAGIEVGVDIEVIDPKLDWIGLAPTTLTPAEREAIEAVAEPDRLAAFYRCWTRKEALLKAPGQGLGLPLAQVEVGLAKPFASIAMEPEPPAPITLSAPGERQDGWVSTLPSVARRFWLFNLPAIPGAVATLASAFAPTSLRCSRFTSEAGLEVAPVST